MKNLSILLLVTLLLTSCGKVVNNEENITSQEKPETELALENNESSITIQEDDSIVKETQT
jgi:hypothetical protein